MPVATDTMEDENGAIFRGRGAKPPPNGTLSAPLNVTLRVCEFIPRTPVFSLDIALYTVSVRGLVGDLLTSSESSPVYLFPPWGKIEKGVT